MISILPISSKLPFITVEVLHNYRLMDCLRFDLGTSIAMLVSSDIENLFYTSSAC